MAAPDVLAGIDQPRADFVRRRRLICRNADGVENVEQQAEAMPLERCRLKSRQRARRRCASEAAIQPSHGSVAQIDRLVANDHISDRAIDIGRPQPEAVRSIDIAEDDMPTIRQLAIDKLDRPGGEIDWNGVRMGRWRCIEDDGGGRAGGLPDRRYVGRERVRWTRESTTPSGAPCAPARLRTMCED